MSAATPVDTFLGKLEGVRKSREGWAARCPAHDDRNASLKVDTGDDGRALFYCFAGCEPESVVAAVGMRLADLFPPKEPTVRQNGSGRRIVATYDYRDEAGDVLYQALRYDPKGFAQRRPDGRGGWSWTLGDVRRVLYRLPEVLAADPAEPVCLCEGEADANRLAALGFTSTTNSAGAGQWRPEYGAALAGRRVVTLEDNDDAGRKRTAEVGAALAGIAAEVRVLALPGLPDRGDVSDWLDAGGDAETLRRLIGAAPGWEPGPAPPPAGPRLIVRTMSDVQPKAVDWLWPRWLAKGKLHILGGHPGDGKSTLTAALAAAFSIGGTLPDGTPASAVRTLFLLAEDALDDTLRPRLDLHGADPARVVAIEAVREADGRDRLFNLSEHLPLLEAAIVAHRVDVVVVDPLTSFLPRSDRNAEGDVRDALTPAGKLAERTGVAVVAVMHVGKPNGTGRRPLQQLLGATAFGAIARIVWMVAPCPDDETGTRRVLGVVKSNLAIKPPPLEWSRAEDGPIVWHGVSEHNLDDLLGGPTSAPRADAEGFLRETLKGGSKPALEVQALAAAAGISERTLRRAREAVGVEPFKQPGTRTGRWLWTLPTGKVATPQGGQVAVFDSSHDSGKMATPTTNGHLPNGTTETEDGQVVVFRAGPLPPSAGSVGGCVECGSPLPVGIAGPYCVLHGGKVADTALATTVAGLLAFSPGDLAAYRAEIAAALPDDPNLVHDRTALDLAESILASASPNERGIRGWRS